ncbi:MAG: regulatory protein GemA [Sphingomonadales bacterium]|nr:regulatory protein GemA [Sphingomonadales bacterium]
MTTSNAARSTTAPARPARFDAAQAARRSMMAKIAIARKDLAMDEDDYRQGLFDLTGKMSATQCSVPELDKVISWLKSKGFNPLPSRSAARHPMALKARALWISLYHLGVVHNPSEQALEAFAKRQLKCDRLAWAKQSEAHRLIEALKDMGRRAGWRMHSIMTQKPLGPIELQSSLCNAILGKLKDVGEAPADWGLHDAMWRLCGIENARERAWTPEDYGRLAQALGKKLRDAGGAHG